MVSSNNAHWFDIFMYCNIIVIIAIICTSIMSHNYQFFLVVGIIKIKSSSRFGDCHTVLSISQKTVGIIHRRPPIHVHTGKLKSRERGDPTPHPQISEALKGSCPRWLWLLLQISAQMPLSEFFFRILDPPPHCPVLDALLNLFIEPCIYSPKNKPYCNEWLLYLCPCVCVYAFFLPGIAPWGLGSLLYSPYFALGCAQRCCKHINVDGERIPASWFKSHTPAPFFLFPERIKLWCDYTLDVSSSAISFGEACNIFLWWTKNLLHMVLIDLCICHTGIDCCDRLCMNAE